MSKRIVINQNNFSGRHYAFQSARSKKPFSNPMQACKAIKLLPSDVVVDIGAYVGEYSLYASRYVQKVISYEASPDTFQVLSMNKKRNMTIHHKAVIGGNKEQITLYLSSGIGATNSIVKKKKDSVIVDAINYVRAVQGASVAKIDVEGAEYEYDIIQPNLRAIILEFHPIGDNWNAAKKIMQNLMSKGFRPAYKIPQFKNGWDTNSAWVRSL